MTWARPPVRRVAGFKGRGAPPTSARAPAGPAVPVARILVRWIEFERRFICYSDYVDRLVPKGAGFWWDAQRKQWWTDVHERAANLYAYCDAPTQARLRPFNVDHAAIEASRATDADIEIPAPPGLTYMPFQRAGIAYARTRVATLFGDEMGLGKTIQAIGVVNLDPEPWPVLVVCPASLKLNWRREMEKWLVKPCLPMLAGDWFPISADVVIINYERLPKWERAIASRKWRTLIVDEAHKVKNDETIRTRQTLAIKAERRLLLTGTPIVNRPAELFTLINYLAPEAFPDAKNFNLRYAKAKPTDARGKILLAELQDRLRAVCMVRRLKRDVLKELPPKVRQVVEFELEGDAALAVTREKAAVADRAEHMITLKLAVELAKAADNPEVYAEAVAALKVGVSASLAEMSKLRHDTAVAKVPDVVAFLKESLESSEEKIVLFAHHRDVEDAYHQAFAKLAVVHRGGMSDQEKDAAERRFKTDPHIRLFIGSIEASGVGINLQEASSHVVFAELDWTPAGMTQAEDRCHRIGQRDSVLVQHLVLAESLDATMAQTLVEKQAVIDAALDETDRAELAAEPIVPGLGETATGSYTKSQVAAAALRLTPTDAEAIHRALKHIAALCDGARALDGQGFNRLDAAIGKSLAAVVRPTLKQMALGRRIVLKYRAQLPEDLAEVIR